MKAENHIIAWIESSRPHYDRLLTIRHCGDLASPTGKSLALLHRATNLVSDAYREMVRGGDALRDDPYSAEDLTKAVALVLAWELEL